jgi:hypothetical protein
MPTKTKKDEVKDPEEYQEEMSEKNSESSFYQPDDEEQEIATKVYERFKNMKDSAERHEAEEDWDYCDKEYEAYRTPLDEDDPRANINKPIAFSIIETELQETIEHKSRPKAKPREFEDSAKTALVNDVLDYSFDAGNFDFQYFLAKQEALVRGTGFLMEYYREDRRTVYEPNFTKDKETGDIKEDYKSKLVTDFDDCYAEYIPNDMVYVDPSGNHISKKRDMILRELSDIDEARLKYKYRRGFYNLENIPFGGADTSTYTYYEPPTDMSDHEVEILHYYNRSLDQYYVLANGVVIRKGPIPGPVKDLPIVVFYCYKRTDKFYGKGVPKIISSLVEERNTLSNLRIDYQRQAISKMFFYDDLVEIDELDLVSRPNGGIPINTQGRPIRDVINWIEYGDVKPSSYREEEVLVEDIRRATGVDDRLQGVNMAGTATEAAILKESSMKRINKKIKLWEMDALVRLGEMRLKNIKFFYPIPKIERIVDDEGNEHDKVTYRKVRVEGKEYEIGDDNTLKMQPKEGYSFFKVDKKNKKYLEGEYDIIVTADTKNEMTKPLKQAKITEMVTVITQNPAFMGQMDPRKAISQYLFVNDEDPKDWLKQDINPDEIKILAEQENELMLAGYPIPPTKNITEDHTTIHLNLTKTPEYSQAADEILDILDAHIKGEAADLGVQLPAGQSGGKPGGQPGGGDPNMASQNPSPNVNPVDITPNFQGQEERSGQQQQPGI